MSRSSGFKGRGGRPSTAYELPGHQSVIQTLSVAAFNFKVFTSRRIGSMPLPVLPRI